MRLSALAAILSLLAVGTANVQGQNTVTWKAGFPAVTNAAAGQNIGSIDVQGTFGEAAGWTCMSVAVQYIPNPAPGGAPATGVATDIVRVAGNDWGKENRAFPGGPLVGVIPKTIPLAVGKYQVWAMGAFRQNAASNAIQFIMTNPQAVEIKAAPVVIKKDPEDPQEPIPPQ